MIISDQMLAMTPQPQLAASRLHTLLQQRTAEQRIKALPAPLLHDLLQLISYSSFVFYLFCRQPELIGELGQEAVIAGEGDENITGIADYAGLRAYKYRQLARICWMDISDRYDYALILGLLSRLAVSIINTAMSLSAAADAPCIRQSLALFALGKLGAQELNFSSDIDLIFTSVNDGGAALQQRLIAFIRAFSRQLEERTEQGFLYRVDLKLRPWGGSGPLVMPVDATENYYEASSEPWERLAWLRARCVCGNPALGDELLQRLRPFIFMRSLSAGDLARFIELKQEMSTVRKRRGQWHVKTGEGGIRDIEFFIHIMQLVNAAAHPVLQQTNTLTTLAALSTSGHISERLAAEVRQSYLFLRRLENRLQMREERQTHALPDAPGQRLVIARSLAMNGARDGPISDDEIMDNFETVLFASQQTARRAFERILPQQALPGSLSGQGA